MLLLTRNTKKKTLQHHKRLIWRWKYVGGLDSVIYKKKEKKKDLKVIGLGCRACPCGWVWVSVLWFFFGWGNLCLYSGWWSWILSLLRAVQCAVIGFGVSMGSPYLWGVLLALAVLDLSISAAAWKWLSQHIFTAASTLLVPGIIAGACTPLSCPALLAEAC